MPRSTTQDHAPEVDQEPIDVGALQAENAALQDRLLRALADADNARRRGERSAEEARRYSLAEFVRELLPIADNLQRALAAADERDARTAGDDALIEGVRVTQRMLAAVLQRFGVRKIEALGTPFDPTLHEAMMAMDDASRPPGTVVQVIEDGYTINDRLLRPARVAVAKHHAEPARSTNSDTAPAASQNGGNVTES